MMERVKEERLAPNPEKYEQRKKIMQEIQDKKMKILLEKRREAEVYKMEQHKNKQTLVSYREESQKQNFERMLLIRNQLDIGNQKKREFLEMKKKNAKREVETVMDRQRNDIQGYEHEAEELERMEAELL